MSGSFVSQASVLLAQFRVAAPPSRGSGSRAAPSFRLQGLLGKLHKLAAQGDMESTRISTLTQSEKQFFELHEFNYYDRCFIQEMKQHLVHGYYCDTHSGPKLSSKSDVISFLHQQDALALTRNLQPAFWVKYLHFNWTKLRLVPRAKVGVEGVEHKHEKRQDTCCELPMTQTTACPISPPASRGSAHAGNALPASAASVHSPCCMSPAGGSVMCRTAQNFTERLLHDLGDTTDEKRRSHILSVLRHHNEQHT